MQAKRRFTLTMDIEVHSWSEATLRAAANEKAEAEGDREFDPSDLSACLVMLIDPGIHPSGGFEIIETGAEEYRLQYEVLDDDSEGL